VSRLSRFLSALSLFLSRPSPPPTLAFSLPSHSTYTLSLSPLSLSASYSRCLRAFVNMQTYICVCALLGDENMLWQCLGVLEEGLSFSPSNAQFKLLLLLLFCRLGAFQPVVDLYSSLDAKHVQHDTIGWVYSTNTHTNTIRLPDSMHWSLYSLLSPRYLLTRYAGSLGQFAAASQSCNFSLRFFHSNQKDVSPRHI
jgi:N-terminal acetyltransferase B complex non-catalytic subunit